MGSVCVGRQVMGMIDILDRDVFLEVGGHGRT